MKKREFLVLGGAVPLMLVGCGGSSSGSAQIRLVNASVGYAALGLKVQSTQITTSDVAYGAASPFVGVSASAVTTTLTTTTGGVVTDLPGASRTLSGNTSYSLVAYGYAGSPQSVLITENQTTPSAGFASLNVFNTSVDIGSIDVYLTPTTDISGSTPIASGVNGVAQSVFAQITAGTYVITVVGANSVSKGISDVRLQVSGVALGSQQVATLVLTPGPSGVLANGVLVVHGTTGTATSYPTTLARVRAIAATGNTGIVAVAGVLAAVASPGFSGYVQVPAGAAPIAQVDGVALPSAGTLTAGTDYTLLIYRDDAGNPKSSLIMDDNRLPVSATAAKVRLINAVLNTVPAQPLQLTLNVNATAVASNVAYATASAFAEVNAVAGSTIQVTAGFTTLPGTVIVTLSPGNIYTMVVVGQGSLGATAGIQSNFSAARL